MSETETRTILITGAASGIGAATARRVAAPGARLLLHTRKNRDGLDAVAEAARAAGARAETVLGDLADPAVPPALVGAATDRFGGLDQIVANAGAADRRPLGELDADGLHAAQRLILDGFFHLVTAALPALQASDWGRVVAVSSFVVHVTGSKGDLFPATAAAKAGVEALARALAFQLAPHGATVNCVAPGYTRKDATGHSALPPESWKAAEAIIPMGRLGTPDDAAGVIAFLLSRDAAFVTGQTVHVNGGLTLP